MKKIFLLLFCLFCINASAQDFFGFNENHSRKDHHRKNDYFTAGLYTGTYSSNSSLTVANNFVNLIGAEIEYFKFSDLSLSISGKYQFTSADYALYNNNNKPSSYLLNVNINGRYYLGKKKVNPYLQLGFSQQTTFVDSYSYSYFDQYSATTYYQNIEKQYNYQYLLNFGVGFKVKLGKKVSFDMKYDTYLKLAKTYRFENSFNGYSVLAGVKYEL